MRCRPAAARIPCSSSPRARDPHGGARLACDVRRGGARGAWLRGRRTRRRRRRTRSARRARHRRSRASAGSSLAQRPTPLDEPLLTAALLRRLALLTPTIVAVTRGDVHLAGGLRVVQRPQLPFGVAVGLRPRPPAQPRAGRRPPPTMASSPARAVPGVRDASGCPRPAARARRRRGSDRSPGRGRAPRDRCGSRGSG